MAEAAHSPQDGVVLPAEDKLRECIEGLVNAADLQTCSLEEIRKQAAVHCGLAETGLDEIKDKVAELVQEAVKSCLSKKEGRPYQTALVLDPEPTNARRCYLVTFSHTDKERGQDGNRLVAPDNYTRSQMKDFVLGAIASTQTTRLQPLSLKYLSVFQERHMSEKIHYHVALLGDRCFRFAPLKRHLLLAHGLASHWSAKSDGYAGCVAYCYMPSPSKPVEHLDLLEASRPCVNAAYLQDFREKQRQARAGQGKGEARVREVDLWPIIVQQNIAADEVGPEKLMSYAKRCGGPALVDFCFSNWDKLQGIIAKSWKAEKVEEFVETATRSRIELLHNAQVGDCTCGGQWATFARTILNQNGHDPAEWCIAVTQALASGRSKGNLVTHAGFEGNEGKSFLSRPLPLVYGEENVFVTPPKSAFPLLGLEKARLVWLDDWRFNEDLISWALQLLWFEGASFIIGRPQNLYAGHLRYTKDDPVFLTTLQADLHSLKGKLKQGDVDMMLKRLKVYDFKVKVDIPSHVAKGCRVCFAKFLIEEAGVQTERPKREATSSGETPEPKRMMCLAWDVKDVCHYLTTLHLGHLTPAFQDNAVDGRMLASLSESDLVTELGLKPLQARKVKERLS